MPVLLTLVLAATVGGTELHVRFADGRPAAGIVATVAGTNQAVKSDAAGLVAFHSAPAPPFTILFTDAEGQPFAPFTVQLPGPHEVVLQPVTSHEVTVTSSAPPNILAPPAAATRTISRHEMERRPIMHLVDAVTAIPGVTRTAEGASGVPVVRGLARGRTLILVDDMRVTAERRAGPSATFLDPFTLSSIEVSRGPGSVAYGSDAFGGVIHARTWEPRAGDKTIRAHFAHSAGGRDETSAGVALTWPLWGGSILGSVYGREGGDAEGGGGAAIGNAGYASLGAALRFSRDLSSGRWRVGIASDRGRDIERPSIDSDVVRARYSGEDSQRLTLGLDVGNAAVQYSIRGSLSTYRVVLERTTVASGDTEVSDVDANDASMRATMSAAVHGGLLETGVDYNSRFGLRATIETPDGGRVDSIRNARRDGAGLFAVYERPLHRHLSLSLGARGDYIRILNDGGLLGSRRIGQAAFSGHAALTLSLPLGAQASAQISRGFREPSLSDRFFVGPTGRGSIIGNPELDPERSTQLDMTVRRVTPTGSFSVSAYHYRIADLVERFRDESDFRFRNQGEALIRGAEVEATLHIAGPVWVATGASIARGTAEPGDTDLAEIPPTAAHASLLLRQRRYEANLRIDAAGADDRPGPSELERPGVVTLEASLQYPLTETLTLQLAGRNLTDRRYFDSPDETSPLATGRTIRVGVQYRR